MSTTFRPYAPDQMLLLPSDMREWLAEGHLAHHISDLVDGLDLTAFYAPYEGDGRRNAPYEPRMMVKVLLYAYATGVFSSREIARKLEEDIAFRVLPARARSADPQHPPRPAGGPPLPRLDGHRGPREAGREGEAPSPPKRKRGRPKKGEERPKVLKRLDRQAAMTLPAMLDDLPTDCDVGMKKDSKGYKSTWVGYKLHLDVADGQIPISCLLTSASLHDSQAAIPLATLSAERTTNLYDLMDAAYDAEPIRQHSRSLGHVPLIDTNPRRDKTLAEELRTEARRLQRIGFQLPEQVRYNERTAGERVNGRLKDEFGGRHVRVRGASKVMCHCMFGVLALTADQLVRLVT